MKKFLVVALLIGAGFAVFGGNKTDDTPTEIPADETDVFKKYNGRIVSDVNGFWMIIRDGKFYNVTGQTVEDWFKANPQNTEVVNAPEDIWKAYSDFYGGVLR